MEAVEFSVANDHPVAGPGWVYAWIHERRAFYIGATWLHPVARAELHLHADTTDPRSLALREVVGALDGPPTVIAIAVSESSDRQVLKAALIRECAERRWLADNFIGPGREHPESSDEVDWLAGAVTVLRPHLN